MENQETLAEYKEKDDAIIYNLVASMRNLEIRIGQIVGALSSRPQGALPSDTKDVRQNHNEQFKPVNEPKEEEKKEFGSGNANHHINADSQDKANGQSDLEKQIDANKTIAKPVKL
ncbi:hypothetical protein V6N13_054029 [Hibiscus sabdariffa]